MERRRRCRDESPEVTGFGATRKMKKESDREETMMMEGIHE